MHCPHDPAVRSHHGRFAATVTVSRLAAFAVAIAAVSFIGVASHAQPFVDVTASFGLPPLTSTPALSQLGAGIVAADIDRDGYLDLLVSGAGGRLVAWRGTAAGGFVPWSGLLPGGRQISVDGFALFDADGDGDLDLWVAALPRSRLYLFETSAFRDVTTTHLPAIFGADTTATPVDLDGDGDLDLLVARYILTPSFPFHRCSTNLYLANDGHGRFMDRTAQIGLAEREGCSFMAVVHDVDRDGRADIVIVNDFGQFRGGQEIWIQTGRNAEGDPIFVESSETLGFSGPVYGMGLAIGDPDLDGRQDWVMTNIGQPAVATWNPPTGRFGPTPGAWRTRLRFGDEAALVTWIAAFEDVDGDGREDLMCAASRLGAAYFLENREPLESVVLMAGPDGWRELRRGQGPGAARDFVFVDLDRDGIPELGTVGRNGDVQVWKNIGRPHAPTVVRLRPTLGASAWGAEVTVACDGVSRGRSVIGGQHFGQTGTAEVRLDLPEPCAGAGHEAVVAVRWPGGHVSQQAIATGSVVDVVEPRLWSVDAAARTVVIHAAAVHEADLSLADLVVEGQGVSLGAEAETLENGDRRYRFEVTAEPFEPLPWLGLRRGEASPFAIQRLAEDVGGARPRLWLGAGRLAVGQVTQGFVGATEVPGSFRGLVLQDMRDGALTSVPTTVTGDGHLFEFVPQRAGSFELHVMGSRTAVAPIEVAPRFDSALSEVAARDHIVLSSASPTAEVRVRTLLRNTNGLRVELTASDLTLWVQGSPVVPDRVFPEGQWLTMAVEQQRLRDGDWLEVQAFGMPVSGGVRFRRLSDMGALAMVVDRDRSGCVLSEPALDPDSRERGFLVARFVDGGAHPVPDTLLSPRWTGGHGLEVVQGTAVTSNNYATVQVAGGPSRWMSGPQAPTVSVGSGTDLFCLARVASREPRFPVDAGESIIGLRSSSNAVGGALEVGVAARFHAVPRSLSGRATGYEPGLDIRLVDGCAGQNATVTGLGYVGGGRHEFFVTPRGGDAVCLGMFVDGQWLRTWRFDVAPHGENTPDGDPTAEPALADAYGDADTSAEPFEEVRGETEDGAAGGIEVGEDAEVVGGVDATLPLDHAQQDDIATAPAVEHVPPTATQGCSASVDVPWWVALAFVRRSRRFQRS